MVKLSGAEPRKLICLPITELRIDRMPLLIVTYPIHNNGSGIPVYCLSDSPPVQQHCSDKLPLHRQDKSSSAPGSSYHMLC